MSNTNDNNNRQSIWSTCDVRVTKFTDYTSKNNLIGYTEVEIVQLNVEIRNISVYSNNGVLSIGLPKVPIGQGLKQTYYPIIVFYDIRDQKPFEKKVREALQTYFRAHNMNPADPDSGILLT
ncbi:MAG: hypothetical protein ABSC04_17685 [Syntrophobacteraceae bacterium]|jgi:hypothetical protein